MAVTESLHRLSNEIAPAHRILAADDDEDALGIIQMFFSKQGYELDVAHDGEQALALLRQRRHDLVLSDVMMPMLDGYRFCELVRADPEISMTPIILITAKDGSANRVLGFEKGADDYITKPFNLFELSARVASTLRNRELRAQLIERDKQLERIRTLEQTLAVISHHINNAIAPIYGRAQLTRPEDPEHARRLIAASVEGCRRVTKTLRVLSQVIQAMKQPDDPSHFDLVNSSLKDIVQHIEKKVSE